MIRDEIQYKLTRLFLPVLLLSAGFTALYSFLNWLLVARTGLIAIDEDVVNLWLPMALPGILVFAFVAPAVRPLKLGKRNLPFLYQLIAVAVIAAPAIAAQGYVRTASGTLTNVESAASIVSAPVTKYYAAKSICLDRANAAAEPEFNVSGSNNDTLNFNLYVAIPVCDSGKSVWIGLDYHKNVENSLPDSQKEAEYQKFAQSSTDEVNALDPSRYNYLERAGINSQRRALEKALKKSGVDAASPTILIPHEEPFSERTGGWLVGMLWSFLMGPVVWFLMLLVPGVDQEKLQPAPEQEHGEIGIRFFIPSPSSYGIAVLLDVNILVYLAMVLSGLGVIAFQTDDLIAWGANYAPLTHGLGISRLITSQFIHGGIMHLMNNMYGLLFASLYLLPVAKNGRLIFCYLLCGLGGSIMSVALHPDTPSVGASGAIFGLFGILLTLFLMRDKRVLELGKGIFLNAGVFVAINLFLGQVVKGIDNAAHIGGLLTGAVIGLALFLFDNREVA